MNVVLSRCVLAMILLCTSLACFAVAPYPNSRFVARLAEDGATIGAVNAVFQDHEGYIWLGGTDGLARYDGVAFEVFRNTPGDPSSISNNAIWALAEDAGGRLWIATDGGLNRFDRASKRFARFEHAEGQPGSIASNTVRSIVLDRKGNLWIGTYGGLARFNPQRASFTNYRNSAPNADQIRTMLVDEQGILWIGSDGGGLSRFDPARASFTNYRAGARADSLSHDVVASIASDRAHRLWIGTGGGGLQVFDTRSGKFQRHVHDAQRPGSLSDNNITAVMLDRDGAVWAGTPLGINVLQPGARDFVHLREEGARDGLPSSNVRSLFQDNNGDIWVGTFPGGISFLNTGTLAFHSYGKGAAVAGGLSHNSVLALHEDGAGDLWLGTDGGGLNRLDGRTRRMSWFQHRPDRPGSLSANAILSIAEDRQGALWLGTWEGGLDRFDPRSGKAEAYFADYGHERTLSSNNTWRVFADRDDRLWIGTVGGGLNRFDHHSKTFTRFLPQQSTGAGIGSPLVWAIEQDRAGGLWLGTGNGLDSLDPASGRFTHYRHRADDPHSVSAHNVLAVRPTAGGVVWLGTRGGGLDRLDPAKGRIERYGSRAGLSGDAVVSIQEDAKGRLWLGTLNGLSMFDPASGRVRTYTRDDGVQGNHFNIGAAITLRSGELVFGGTQGYTRFFPDQVQDNRYRPPVVFRGFTIFNKPVVAGAPGSPLRQAIEHTRDITLDYRQSVFSIEYAALGYRNASRNRYAYRLAGFDKDWNEVGTQRSATYTNLDAGDYTFMVKASNDEGLWNDQPATLRIHVLPPPWASWWARSLYALALAGAATAFLRFQHRKALRQLEINRMLEHKVAERTRQLAEKNTDLEHMNRKLEEISLSDPLTGLNNRRYLSKCIGADSALSVRAYQRLADDQPGLGPGEQDLLFFLMDVDHFKSVNDTYGHANGDAVLVQMAAILRQTCREGDMVLRWGGEEFLVVSRFTDRRQAPQIAERFRAAVESHVFQLDQGRSLRKTCSIGFACFPFKPEAPNDFSVEQVIDIADRCLYQVKRQQRNGWMGMSLRPGSGLGFDDLAAHALPALDAGQIVLDSSISAPAWCDAAGIEAGSVPSPP